MLGRHLQFSESELRVYGEQQVKKGGECRDDVAEVAERGEGPAVARDFVWVPLERNVRANFIAKVFNVVG